MRKADLVSAPATLIPIPIPTVTPIPILHRRVQIPLSLVRIIPLPTAISLTSRLPLAATFSSPVGVVILILIFLGGGVVALRGGGFGL